MIVAKMHRNSGQAILAACDIELLGKVLKGEGDISTKVSRTFFGEEEVSKDDFLIMLAQSSSANLFGEETIGYAMEAGYIDEECIIDIGGVPHAQLFII